MTTLEPGRAPGVTPPGAPVGPRGGEPVRAGLPALPPATAPGAGGPVDRAGPPRRRAVRVSEGAVLGGVCTGLAQYFGWPVLVVRIVFVGLAIAQLFGVLAYGALWLLMPAASTVDAPGLEAATRTGMRTGGRPRRRSVDWGAVLALAALGTGMLWLVQTSGLGVSQRLFWPVAFACVGAALVWRQADSSAQQRWRAEAGGRVWLAPLVARGGWPALVRVIVGLGLVGASFGLVVAQYNQLAQLPQVLAMTLLALAGIAVVIAPWLHRSRAALNEARAEKVRADARADMAAHLHDSVLQTLAMIQKQSEDPRAVAQLARRQERELRGWLYADDVPEASLKAALTAAAAEVEDERGVPVELVVVGDCDTSDAVQALVRAAREAMVNAAKHSGADKIDVYAEVTETLVEVFVRDRGAGFDLDAVADDRHGVRGSILNRMARHGGRASVRSQPGDGTEVRLEVTR
ncbi:Signal transduction histidine kinase [Microlunatus sagamiharensis]|uniref:Signal transduction histidine kinase n=1 Tax=Microlunatus sagamiharensis TaxID=546874 RepID=A0A1H2LJG9_9ACTN|nr:PspC domain-containing protein [Microlunatus sagamiharensis]SDU80546.1 Signal transduction histidine kinase [Microlunatus sagamiharensis]